MSGYLILWSVLCIMALFSSQVRGFVLAKPGTRFAGPPPETRTESARILHMFLRGLLLILIIGILVALGNLAWEAMRPSGSAVPMNL